MAGVTAGIELSAISVLKRAITHEEAKQYNEALVCYQEGIDLLLQVVKGKNKLFLKFSLTFRSNFYNLGIFRNFFLVIFFFFNETISSHCKSN